MIINTKYDVGEIVFMLERNNIYEVKIERIKAIAREYIDSDVKVHNYIYYNVSGDRKDVIEEKLHNMKKDALQALIKQLGYEISEDHLKEINVEEPPKE